MSTSSQYRLESDLLGKDRRQLDIFRRNAATSGYEWLISVSLRDDTNDTDDTDDTNKAHLIIWGTVTLELSSKAFIISPLQRMLSMHCGTDSAEGMLVSSVPRRLLANILSSECCRLWFGLTCLADVTGPGRLLLPRGGHQDDREWLAVLWLHHNLEVQVLHVLAGLVRFGFRQKIFFVSSFLSFMLMLFLMILRGIVSLDYHFQTSVFTAFA